MAAKSKAKSSRRDSHAPSDAIALLKADHRQVEEWFSDFEAARTKDRKRELAAKICKALEVHTQIEEQVFYPAFLEATGEKETHHEAVLEHGSAKLVIADIENSDPEDDYYDSRMKVLSEMIKHHVKEEEQPGGMFAKARAADLDLKSLGEALKNRKEELEHTALRPVNRAAQVRIGV